MNSEHKDQAASQLFTLVQQRLTSTSAGSQPLPGAKYALRASGEVIDQKYKILSLLGEGGMGAVYKAQQLNLDRVVALKTFRSDSFNDEAWQRFQREAQTIGRITHNNIVQVFDFGVDENNVPFYTMECLEGQSLADLLEEESYLSLPATLQIFLQVCRGLGQAHKQKIIHRDLKPGNIFLVGGSQTRASRRTAKIVDFGLAGLATQSMDSQKLTATGTIFGSPLYMSPEQSLGYPADERSDIYSLGCALFETLTGNPPFRGENSFATILQHQNFPVPIAENPVGDEPFPQRLESLLISMMAKDPANRTASCQQVEQELQEILRDFNQKSSRPTGLHQSGEDESSAEKTSFQTGSLKKTIAITAVCLIATAAISVGAFMIARTKPAAVAKQKDSELQPYLKSVSDSGNRTFVFPEGKNLGVLHFQENKGRGRQDDIAATNTVIIPSKSFVTLKAGGDLEQNPQLFDGFSQTDLDEIKLESRHKWTDETIKYLAKLTGLSKLVADDINLTAACLPSLNKLGNLRVLSVKNTTLTGKDLAKLENAKNLVNISTSNMPDVQTFLDSLSGSTKLDTFRGDNCSLDDNALKTLATMPNLRALEISKNKNITDRGLKYLVPLPRLTSLAVDHTGISPKSIEIFKQMRLTYVCVDANEFSHADFVHLRKSLPFCKIYSGPENERAIDLNKFVEGSKSKSAASALEELAR